jgi:drug/metabolite transporter (DMT)-like permease
LLSGSINFPIGRLLNFTGVRLAGVAKSSPIVGSSPMFAIALAVTVGGETVNAPILVGTMAIIGGLTLILTQR